VVVRADLSIPQQLCQAVHAAHESGIRFGNPNDISSVVVCSVPDETSLLLEQEKVESKGIKTILFREPDINNQATAFATELIPSNYRKVFSKLVLWKGNDYVRNKEECYGS
jgi:hypothetical protein